MTWNAVTGAAYYDVWINDLTTNTAQVLRNQNVSGTSLSITSPLTMGDTFQWWARGFTSNGTAGAWSATATFTIAALGTPTAAAPSGTIASATPLFSWSATAGATAYDLWVNDDSTGQAPAFHNAQVIGTTFTPTLQPGHFYQWWIRALSGSGSAVHGARGPRSIFLSPCPTQRDRPDRS